MAAAGPSCTFLRGRQRNSSPITMLMSVFSSYLAPWTPPDLPSHPSPVPEKGRWSQGGGVGEVPVSPQRPTHRVQLLPLHGGQTRLGACRLEVL